MDKYGNTLKMMGVSFKDALFFSDNLKIYHLTINPSIKAKIKSDMLNQLIMDKTISEWFIYYGKQTDTNYKFNPDNIEADSIKGLIELIVQEFYKKEKIIG